MPSVAAKSACYLYALAPRDAVFDLAGLTGVGGGEITVSAHGDFLFVFEEVAVEEFTQEKLEENLQDLRWVEDKVRTHDRIEHAVSVQTTALPFRFCTILAETDALSTLAREKREEFSASLQRVAGAREWGVKFLRLSKKSSGPKSDDTPRSGTEFLMRKKRSLDEQTLQAQRATEAAVRLARSMRTTAREATTIPLRQRQDRTIVLNTSFLVAREEEGDFRKLVDGMRREAADAGLSLNLTGPWPPYSFTTK